MSPIQRTRPAHRRARRSGRFVVGIVVAAIVIAGGTAAAIAALNGGGDDRATTTVTPGKTQDAATSATPTPTTSQTPSPSAGSDDSEEAAALTSCRTTIEAAQAAADAARTGAGHWSIHTRARTDFLAHKITLAKTNAEFKRTKLLGPADQKAFADALAAYEKVADGCNGLSSSSDAAATTCATKAEALGSTVKAGQAVMKDWASHLNNMALHADHEMSATRARDEWIAAWKAAPANLNAFSAADAASTKTPSCPAS